MSRATQSIFGLCGVVLPFAGAAAPDGWMLCHGQAVSRAAHAHLFAVIGTAFGTGDGTTTFNLPDLRGRVAAGKDNMGGAAASRLTTAASGVNGATLGAAGGAETHTLTTPQMPSHTHGVTDPTHTHAVYDPGHVHSDTSFRQSNFDSTGGSYPVGQDVNGSPGEVIYTDAAVTSISLYAAYTGVSIQNQGGGGAHNNTQPTIVLNHIIKT